MAKSAATKTSAAAAPAAPAPAETAPVEPAPAEAQSAEARSGEYEPLLPRIPILDLSPQVDEGHWAASAFSGEVVPFRATAFREGHDRIGVDLLLLDPSGAQTEHHMRPLEPGTDRVEVAVELSAARCEAHALTESNKTFRFSVWVSLGDGPSHRVEVLPEGEPKAALEAAMRAGCFGTLD